jgi:diguanylate cyclase (GGDEF)-like protein/PAS domain S-box-containing protein
MHLDGSHRYRLSGELNSLQREVAELCETLSADATLEPRREPPPIAPRELEGGPGDSYDREAAAPGDGTLEQIVAGSPDGIFAFDREGILAVWNAEMERIFDLPASDVIGRHAFEVLPPLAGALSADPLLRVLQGETIHLSGEPFSAGDRQGSADVRLVPVIGGSGEVTGVAGFLRDVTARKQASDAELVREASYAELFETANDMVYALDLHGRFTSLNRAAERITGYSRNEALQMSLLDFVAPDQLPLARDILQRQLAGEAPATHEFDFITKSGARIALEISTHLISRSGRPLGIQGIARDITERKKTEDALQHAKLKLEAWVHELEQRTREMTLLSEMGDMLRACLTTDEAYSVIVRVAQQIFPVQVGALYVITPSRNLVEAVALWGDASLAERVFSPDECWALRRGRVHWVEDPSVGLVCKHLHQPAPDGYLCVPMMAQSEALGVLHLAQPANARLTEAKQRLAVAMAEHIAMALSNLRLHETLRSQSIRDPLTGLFNRRFMEESLELELRRAVRNQRPLSVIMLDLDRFKHFNDTYGHDAGDTLLRELGTLLQTNIRGEDIACRYGGEEFTLIMPEGSAEIARQRAELIRRAIGELQLEHRGQPLGNISVSLGVAVFPEHGRTRDALLQAADSALYMSKAAGGDKVTVAK